MCATILDHGVQVEHAVGHVTAMLGGSRLSHTGLSYSSISTTTRWPRLRSALRISSANRLGISRVLPEGSQLLCIDVQKAIDAGIQSLMAVQRLVCKTDAHNRE